MDEKRYRGPLIRDYTLYRCPVTGCRLEERGEEIPARVLANAGRHLVEESRIRLAGRDFARRRRRDVHALGRNRVT
jgi:hypothetical protein